MRLVSPKNTEIIGTYERISGVAGINPDTLSKNSDGTFQFDYDGGTRVYWSSQKTVRWSGKRVFLDEGGATWTEDQLKLVE